MLTIEKITSRDDWNNTLATLPHAHILQSWEWGQLKHETTGWFPHRWQFKQGNEVVAMASVGARSVGPFCMMYAPKGPAMAYDDPDLVREVIEALEQKAREHRAIWLKLDPDINRATGFPNEEDDTPDATGQAIMSLLEKRGWRFSDDQIQFRNTMTVDLTEPEDDILMAMSGNTRRKVRTADKKDVTIRHAGLDDIDVLYRLYETTGDRNDFLVRDKAYYRQVWQVMMENNKAHALIAEYEGLPIAHVILFHFGETVWYFYGASSNKERNRMPNYALQWEAMKWAKAQGYKTYDMWGAPDEFNEDDDMWGVYMFKNGFRPTIERRLGAWDYAPYPLLYKAYAEIYPRFLNWMRRRNSE